MVALGDLPTNWRAYVDADWLRLREGLDVPAILADPEGALRWRFPTAPPLRRPSNTDPDLAASRAMAWSAQRAVDAVSEVAGDVKVIGNGALFLGIRQLLSERSGTPSRAEVASRAVRDRPSAVIVTVGEPSALLTATQQVVELGLIVLAGEAADPMVFNFYPDVHVRGLALVGVPGPLGRDEDLEPHALESLYRDLLVQARYGEHLHADARWFCFSREVNERPPISTPD